MRGEEGLDKSVGLSRVPTTSEPMKLVIKLELIKIRDDEHEDLKDEIKNMPATTGPDVVEFTEVGLGIFGGDLNLAPLSLEPIGILFVTVERVTKGFSRIEDFLKQQVVETRKLCEEEARDEIHGLKEKLSPYEDVSSLSSSESQGTSSCDNATSVGAAFL
ncbi:hypothetical protein D8674_006210 [Pyrus ussuriensis x Pyrus communis]|uniref:Uncharacterized protein n=1 Tax=Pyrus ussuriensis x Pyrus communis TaxID=2448454 RepID=A0A5N5FTZ3_9ROSA|nr:hypothetical protein D8674_006210 [Pyrus ussuriensis x Pyrus communis]